MSSNNETVIVEKKKTFYIFDFLKKMMKPRNIPLFIYLLIDSMFIFTALFIVGGILLDNQIQDDEKLGLICAAVSFVLYFGSMFLSLSPVGEAFLRLKLGCKEIKNKKIYDRMMPIFLEVYEKAKIENPSISSNIKLFMQMDDSPNAFATGRNTVCFTSGLLTYSDDQIKGVLAHEFGHLSNKDTDLTLVVNVANTFIHFFFLAVWAVLFVLRLLGKAIAMAIALFNGKIGLVVNGITRFVFKVLSFILIRLIEKIWNIIGNLLIQFSSRGAEFNADLFALKTGFGDGLIGFFETLPDAVVGKKTKLSLIISRMSTIGHSHPATWRRIDNLKKAADEMALAEANS